MDEEGVAQFLIEKRYNLTALELMAEIYERNGATVPALSTYFQDSANFLSFDTSVAVSEMVGDSMEEGSSEAIRIKNDKIALLEHEISVLKDQLKEAGTASPNTEKNALKLKSPGDELTGNTSPAEEAALKLLVHKYLQAHSFKMSSISFANEAGKPTKTAEIEIPDDVDLMSLLRTFIYTQNTSRATNELEKLKREKVGDRDKIAQLGVDLDVYKTRVAELEAVIEQMKNSHVERVATEETKTEEKKVITEAPSEPPSVQLLDTVLAGIKPLMSVVKRDSKVHLLDPMKTIIKNHPVKRVRMECIENMFSFYDDPTNDECNIIVKAMRECSNTQEKAEGEILPYVTQMMASQQPSTLCLVCRTVAGFADLCSMQLRSTLLFSIIRQLAEHSNPIVRAAAAVNGAALIRSFGNDDDAAEKLHDLIDLGKQFVFDADGEVQSAGVCSFIPALLGFVQQRKTVGKTMFEYWLKLALSFGLTGSSQLAVIRFKLCIQVLETIIMFLLPRDPADDEKIVCEGEECTEKDIVAAKSEYDWIKDRLPQVLPEFSPILYVQIPIKKEANSLVNKCCRAMGKQFTISDIAPVFMKLIDSGPLEHKMHHVAMFLSAVACFDSEMFYVNSRNYITYSNNETHEFKQSDVQAHIAFAFSLLSSRDASQRPMIMKLVDELVKSTRSSIRSSAVAIIREIMPTLDQKELENDVMPFISRLANDPDESLQMETVNCVGTIARFATSTTVVRTLKELIEDWFKGNATLKLQVLRTLGSNASDIDSQFRDTFILPKLLECLQPGFDWGMYEEQAFVIIVQFIASLKDEFSENVIKNSVAPIVQILSENPVLVSDPMLKGLKEQFPAKKAKSLL